MRAAWLSGRGASSLVVAALAEALRQRGGALGRQPFAQLERFQETLQRAVAVT